MKRFRLVCRLHVIFAFILLLLVSLPASILAQTVQCKVVPVAAPTEAQNAFLHSDYEKAAALYQAQLQLLPNDAALTAEFSLVLLRQQKVQEASDLVHKALKQHPGSVDLLTALGEVQYREGTPWLAGPTIKDAMKVDPCYPRLRLLSAKLLLLSSYYGLAAKEIKIAHMLAPHDPEIRRVWLGTLPLEGRITELESYLEAENGEDAETKTHLHFYLDFLKHQLAEPHKSCRLVSDTEAATVPFAAIRHDPTHIRAFGLDVKLNGYSARLQIDTGSSGLIISRSAAEHAGLKQFSRNEIAGIGNQGRRQSYMAYADDIRIGSLEFRDCEVDVIDQGHILDVDGLIGADVFSNFLVTLDYPMRRLQLAPLPKRPNESTPIKPALETTNDGDSNSTADTSSTSPSVPRGPRDRYIDPTMKEWTPVYRIGHNLMLPAALNDSTQKMFLLDTGAFSTSISPEVAREVTKVHSDSHTQVRGISGKVDKVYSADSITFRFARVSQRVDDVLSFSTDSISKSTGMDISGLIGITALGQLKIDIDYRDGLMNFTYDRNRGYKF